MSEPNSQDARRGLPSDAPAPSPEADDKYAVPRFALGRPKTVYSDTTPTDRPAARPKAAPAPSPRARTGSRRSHRSDTDRRFKNSLALTAASTVVPGSGMLGAPLRRTKAIGAVLALAFLAVIAEHAGLFEHGINECGFSVVNVCDDRYVAKLWMGHWGHSPAG